MRTAIVVTAVMLSLLVPVTAAAQENPLTGHSLYVYTWVKKILLRSAELMPEEHYAFKPAPSVRTFGEIVGHVADSQYGFCAMVIGEKSPRPNVEKTKTSKADLITALQDAFAYCDKAYAGLTDAGAAGIVKFGSRDTPRLGIVNINNVHSVEHYGNLVTYMRMKELVPPTSDPEFMKPEKK